MKTADELKQIIKNYCVAKGWGDSDKMLEEMLTSADTVFQEQSGSHRWWNDIFKVVDVDGTLIGFTDAETTGDLSANEMGWFIDWNALCEVKAKETVTTVYAPVTNTEEKKWLVHIVGPDDVIEQSGEVAALRFANNTNIEAEKARREFANDPNYPYVIALVKNEID